MLAASFVPGFKEYCRLEIQSLKRTVFFCGLLVLVFVVFKSEFRTALYHKMFCTKMKLRAICLKNNKKESNRQKTIL